jgi:predicted O-methyltransferase YrrM
MNYEAVYEAAVLNAPENALFIELGTFLGRSAAYMGQLIKESGKNIDFITVDLFEPSGNDHAAFIQKDMFEVVISNIKNCGVEDYVTVVKGSTQALIEIIKKRFPGRLIDFVFIDADHRYEGVKKDITSYWPLLKKGGTMAGHDYNLNDVKCAVHDIFTINQLRFYLNTWMYTKPNELSKAK